MSDHPILTEKWLNINKDNSELGLINYNIYQCNRSILSRLSCMGGGVLIDIIKDVFSSLLKNTIPELKQLFVSFN